jgi:hypothetical protein
MMYSKRETICKALTKHWDYATTYSTHDGRTEYVFGLYGVNCHYHVTLDDTLINPYDIVNICWERVYEDFSGRIRV